MSHIRSHQGDHRVQLDAKPVADELSRLRRKDHHCTGFGASEHQYQLNPPLSSEVVNAFEQKHGITLPEDYRHFVTTIGNGGAGPFYGLFPFGEEETGRRWEDVDAIGTLAEPFPYIEAWNLPKEFWSKEPDPPPGTPLEEEDRMMAAWDQELIEQYWNPQVMNGAIPICDRGCGLSQWLIVNGPQRGYVWNDDRADHAGISPLRDPDGKQMTFTDWYLNWLENAEDQHIAATKRLRQSASPRASVRDWAFLLAAVVGIFPGAAFAAWHDWSGRGIQLASLVTATAAIGLFLCADWLLRPMRKHRQAKAASQSPSENQQEEG